MFRRASVFDVLSYWGRWWQRSFLRAQGNSTPLPSWLPAVPILSCHSRAVIEEEIADSLGLIQFQFSTVKGVVAPNVIQQTWWRGAHSGGVSSFAVHDQRFSSWDLLYVFFGLTKVNLSLCAGHCLVTERKLSCNAAACLNVPLELSWALQSWMWIFHGYEITYFFHPEYQCGSLQQGGLCILACPVTVFCNGSRGWRE